MENAAQAIKMAGAIIVFTMALAVVMNAFTAARAAADGVMNKKDYTKTYYAADETAEETNEAYKNYDLAVQKIVGIDEVIATMYNYRKEGTTILFYTAKSDKDIGDDFNLNASVYGNDVSAPKVKPLILYYTEALPYALAKSSLGLEKYSVNNTSGSVSSTAMSPSLRQRAIYGLSSSDEITRNEPWIGDDTQTRLFIDDLIAGREAATVVQRTPFKTSGAHYYNRLSTFVKGVYVSNNSAFTNGRNNYLSYGFCPTGAPTNNSLSGDQSLTALGPNNEYAHSNFGTSEMHNISNFLGFDKNARFVERIGEYDYKSRIVDSSGNLRDEGTVELDNGEVVEADITVSRRKIIQFIYLTGE